MGTQLCMVILKRKGELQQQKFDFLLRGPRVPGVENPLPEWVSDTVWSAVQALRVSPGSAPCWDNTLCYGKEMTVAELCVPVQEKLIKAYPALASSLALIFRGMHSQVTSPERELDTKNSSPRVGCAVFCFEPRSRKSPPC